MTVKETIERRRAYRSLAPVEVTDELVRELAGAAQLAPTCFNNQPARFVFVRDPEQLKALRRSTPTLPLPLKGEGMKGRGSLEPAFSKGNEWCRAASLVIAVCAKKEDDCVIRDREYYLFDAGLQTAFLVLRATELGLVAHPIAGYSPKQVRLVLGIPEEMAVVTLVIVGRHGEEISPLLSEQQAKSEKHRPTRLPFEQVTFFDRWPETPQEEE